MDRESFASLARIRILLIPIGSIRKSVFEKWVQVISSFDHIRLGDVPPDAREERSKYMPAPLAQGHLHLTFISHPPPESYEPLSLIRLSDFPLGIIGIANASSTSELSALLAEFNAAVGDIHPWWSQYSLAINCIAFEEEEGTTNLDIGDALSGLVVIPSVMGNKKLYIGTLLAELCSNILGSFSEISRDLESESGIDAINAATFPSIATLKHDRIRGASQDLDQAARFSSEPPKSPPLEIQTTDTRTYTPTPSYIRRTSSNSAPNSKRGSLNVTPTNKKRNSTIGVMAPHARLYKILGDLFLLAGRISDANIWYEKSISVFKSMEDNVWHASAIEGLCSCIVLEAWSVGLVSSISSETFPRMDSFSDLLAKMTSAISLYGRQGAPFSETPDEFAHMTLFYVKAILRQARFALSIWLAKGWNQGALQTMLTGFPDNLIDLVRFEHRRIELSEASGLSCSQIAAILSQAHGPFLVHLGAHECIQVLSSQATIYACLGFKRKEVFLLREVVAVIMDMIVRGRDGTRGVWKTSVVDLSFGTPSSEGILTSSSSSTVLAARQPENIEGNDSVIQLVTYICQVYGVDITSLPIYEGSNFKEGSKSGEIKENLSFEDMPIHGWPELQVGVVREAVAVAECLPDYPSVAQFSLSALRALYRVLDPEDQQYLHTTSLRALNIARRRGSSKYTGLWLDNPVVGIEVLSAPAMLLPIEHSIEEINTHTPASTIEEMGKVFIYNPRQQRAGGSVAVTQNELLEVSVKLFNPFSFPCDIPSLALSTSGVPFHTQPIALSLPPTALYTAHLTGIPLEPGTLIIEGCVIQLPGCHPKQIAMQHPPSIRRISTRMEANKNKFNGLASRSWEKEKSIRSFIQGTVGNQASSSQHYTSLRLKVVATQPLLRIKRTSLIHGSLMLYNGERSVIRLTIENISKLPVNFIRMSFSDSTSESIHETLSEGALSALDTYDLTQELSSYPIFRFEGENKVAPVGPGECSMLAVSCLGKAGCTNGTISLAYAHIPEEPNAESVFHTRQIEFPMMVTVYHALEIHSMNIFPYLDGFTLGHASLDLSIPDGENPASWCLFTVEVRNSYGYPFDVTFERVQPDLPRQTVALTISPEATSRIILPLKRVDLSDSKAQSSIPTPAGQQFVLAQSEQNAADEALQRAIYWYREALLSFVHGHWKETAGSRCGDLFLHRERLTSSMLEVLKAPRIQVSMGVNADPGSHDVSERHRQSSRPNEFCYLHVRVTNAGISMTSLALSLSVDPSEHAIVEGNLTNIPLHKFKPGEQRSHHTCMCFVSRGKFRICASVRPLDSDNSELAARTTLLVEVDDGG